MTSETHKVLDVCVFPPIELSMNALEALLAERSRIIKELTDLENLLRSRFRWPGGHEVTPTTSAEPSATEGLPSEDRWPKGADFGRGRAASINYSAEAKDWLADAPHPFTVLDFRDYLERKFGAGFVNPSSLNGPIRRLAEEKLIVVVEQGQGRRPTKYTISGREFD